MRAAFFLTLFVAVLGPAAGSAQMSENEQRQACMGDAIRLCASAIPDRGAVTRCMSGKYDELTPTCRLAFDGGPRRRSDHDAGP